MFFCEVLSGVLLLLVQQYKTNLTVTLLLWAVIFSFSLCCAIDSLVGEPAPTGSWSVAHIYREGSSAGIQFLRTLVGDHGHSA